MTTAVQSAHRQNRDHTNLMSPPQPFLWAKSNGEHHQQCHEHAGQDAGEEEAPTDTLAIIA